MEVRIIRGYKLKLWKDRLGLAPDFVERIDLTGLNYVHLEHANPNGTMTIVLFTKMRGSKSPIPTVIRIDRQIYESISERVELDANLENRSYRSPPATSKA